MQPYPHRYTVAAAGGTAGGIVVSAPGLASIETAAPAEFGGPGDRWSPETLLAAAVADCLILTFRAVARAAKLEWTDLACTCEAVLDRVDGVSRFTRFAVHAVLTVPASTDQARAKQLLEKAEHGCLVANSLTGERTLTVEFRTQA